tara:strand:- start:382 stop:1590 length:1209 start_codon:yes stop_codon:yes gene_type:complete
MILNGNNILIFFGLLSFFLILFSIFFELYIFNNAPFLKDSINQKPLDQSLTIVIPAYNEELNLVNCLKALSVIKKPCKNFKILIIDDESTDDTYNCAIKCKKEYFKKNDSIEIISSGERPTDKNWVGKNWACYKGSRKVTTDWILFIDADVIIGKNCIFNALLKSSLEDIDLLSLAPKINCSCLSEWMVQPIMANLLMLGFPIFKTNDSSNKDSFAAGPFMLFKKKSYDLIGGHLETYNEVVEDLALAEKIKSNNLKLNFSIAINDLSINMYRDFFSLIEGWSKNWFLGLDKNLLKSVSASIFVFFLYSFPWILFLISIIQINYTDNPKINFLILLISSISIISYGIKRLIFKNKFNIPDNYWYLNSIGGFIVIYISFLSIYRTVTGNGWTWKGRKLNKKFD